MHILLPPSETKRSGGGDVYAAEALAYDAQLRPVRHRVRTALVQLCQDREAAAKALKLGVKNISEIEHNLELDTSGAVPAVERYTGVLYDALDAQSLDDPRRSWIDEHVLVQSALFGLIRASDRIPTYRLSASTRLSVLRTSLKRAWSKAHSHIDWAQLGLVLDMRSKDYVALAPLPEGVGLWLHVMQRGPEGEVRALNHFNKAAKGELVRALALSGALIDSADDFLSWASEQGFEAHVDAPGTLTLVTPTASG